MNYDEFYKIIFSDIENFNKSAISELRDIEEKFFMLFSSLGIILAIISLFSSDFSVGFDKFHVVLLIIIGLLIILFIILVFIGIRPKGFPILYRYPFYYDLITDEELEEESDQQKCKKIRDEFIDHKKTYYGKKENLHNILNYAMLVYVLTIISAFILLVF